MKQYIKRYVIFLYTSIILCTMAACGNTQSELQIFDSPNTQPEYLSFFSSQRMIDSDVSKYWIDRFTEKYNKQIYISFDNASYYADEGLSYRELLEKRLESSSPDDLYIINAEDVLEFEKKGYWLDLSGMDFINNLSDAALYQSTYNGKVFSIPLSFTGFGFLWNVDLLEEHSLAVPQNLQEFLDVCEKLKSEGILPYGANKGFALTVPAMCAGLSTLYQSTDSAGKIAALNSGETAISSYVYKGFDFLTMMIEKGYMDPRQAIETTPHQEDVELFLAGKCAFICTGLNNFHNVEEHPFLMELTGLPILPDGCIAVYGADHRLCVNPNSKHLDTALEFIEMVGTPDALTESAQMDHSMSSAMVDEVMDFPTRESLVDLLQQPNQIPNQDFALHFNTWESIRDAARALCQGASVEQACILLDERQQTDLEEYGNR